MNWKRALLWTATAALSAAALWRCAAGRSPTAATVEPFSAAGRYPSAVLDINTAEAGALEELPGIGPVLAERIIAARAENGPFTGPEDLLAVSGVGPALWEDIEPFVDFGK